MRDTNGNSEKQIDSMGCYIGQVRAHEGVSLEQLAQGLCTKSYLCRVENGEREAGKLLTDALLQQLGKPVELFDRILDWKQRPFTAMGKWTSEAHSKWAEPICRKRGWLPSREASAQRQC